MVTIEFMDISDDLLLNITKGPFESVQVTNNKVRDQDGNLIADLDYDLWLVDHNGTVAYYSDFVVSAD